jgi:hypothetical protein
LVCPFLGLISPARGAVGRVGEGGYPRREDRNARGKDRTARGATI